MTFVLDNSVTMRWCFGDGSDKDRAYARKIMHAVEKTAVVVPAIWGLEVANVVARAESKELWPEPRSRQFLDLLGVIEIEVDDETFSRSLTDTLAFARRYRLSAYDASYLELAARRKLQLATLDEGLRKAARKAGVEIFA